jgi:IclR helix-turn-helix domain
MTNDEPISITLKLSPTQVEEVLSAASRGRVPTIAALIAHSLSAPSQPPDASSEASAAAIQSKPRLRDYMPASSIDPRLSRSLMRGLSILTCFGPDGGARGIVELAGDLDMSPSTAHRYALTLVELGLLERCPRTRKYRLPQA